MNEKKIVRPRQGRMLFGVAAGIANYFGIDPVIVRLIFVILAVSGGAGVLIYIIGIFVIPEEPKNSKENKGSEKNKEVKDRVQSVAEEIKTTVKDQSTVLRGEQVFGLILLFVGLIFLTQMFVPWLSFGKFWPMILIIIGLIMIANIRKEK